MLKLFISLHPRFKIMPNIFETILQLKPPPKEKDLRLTRRATGCQRTVSPVLARTSWWTWAVRGQLGGSGWSTYTVRTGGPRHSGAKVSKLTANVLPPACLEARPYAPPSSLSSRTRLSLTGVRKTRWSRHSCSRRKQSGLYGFR